MKKNKKNSDGKINWNNDFEKYQPVNKERPNWRIERETNSDRMDQIPSYELYISQEAKSEVFDHISFGKKTADNVNEQGGVLLGEVGFDAAHNTFFGNVIASVAARKAEGNSVHLAFSHDDWNDLQHEIDRLNENREVPLTIIGWYHTHPNTLDVFMSGTDKTTQSQWFNEDWHFAVVINPHRKIWRAFHGANADECSGYFYGEEREETSSREVFVLNEIDTSADEITEPVKKVTKSETKNVRKITKYYSILFIGLLATGGVVAYLFMRSPVANSHKENNSITAASDSLGQALDSSLLHQNTTGEFTLDTDNRNVRSYLENTYGTPDSVSYTIREDVDYQILTLSLFFQDKKETKSDSTQISLVLNEGNKG